MMMIITSSRYGVDKTVGCPTHCFVEAKDEEIGRLHFEYSEGQQVLRRASSETSQWVSTSAFIDAWVIVIGMACSRSLCSKLKDRISLEQ